MARPGRSFANRPVVTRNRHTISAAVDLPVFEIAAEFPALDILTPDARIKLGPFEIAAEFPALRVKHDEHVALPAFEIAAEFPTLGVHVPVLPGALITGDYQIEYGGLLFGKPPYMIEADSVEGWEDLAEMDSGNVLRPSRHGAWPGEKLGQQRYVSARVVAFDDSGAFMDRIKAIRRAASFPRGTDESPLVIRTRGETLVAYGTINARTIPTTLYPTATAVVSLRWECADPRRFGLRTYSTLVTTAGSETLTNEGDAEYHPRIRIRGPAANPTFTNEASGLVLAFAVELLDGEVLIADCDTGRVTIDDVPADALSALSAPIELWTIDPGDNPITYTVTTGGGQGAEIFYRDAYS